MSFENGIVTPSPEVHAEEGVDRVPSEIAYVTSDLRGVSWREQEILALGPEEDPPAGTGALAAGPEAPAAATGSGPETPARPGSFWSFGGPADPAPRAEPPRGWRFGGADDAAPLGEGAAHSRRF